MAGTHLPLAVLLGTACAGTNASEPAPAAAPQSCVEQVRAAGKTARRGEPTGPQDALPTVVLSIGSHDLVAEVADSPAERGAGLMFRDALAPHTAMVFVYPNAQPRSFWMRNTCLPLSIAYINAEGTILTLADMTPLNERGVPSGRPAQYALEVPQGWFARKGISVGDRVVGLPPASPR